MVNNSLRLGRMALGHDAGRAATKLPIGHS
jgi:hypothetical protein